MGDLSLNPISSYLYYPTRGNQLAAVFGMGVYQLDHNGLNWQEFEPKLEDKAVLDLAIDDDTLYALTEEALYKFDGSEWRRIGLPVAENDLDQNWLEIYAEAVGESIEMVQPRFEASQLTVDGVLENKVIPHRIRVIDGKVYLLSHGSGAFLRGDDSWAQIDVLDGKVLDLTENHHNNKLFASVCSLDGACQLLTYDGIDWQVQDGKLANIRINSFFSNRNDFFATTEHGIYRWDDVNEDWYQVCESEHDILSMTQAADPCRLAAGGVGEYFISNDCGDTWLQYQTEDAWHYQALIFLPLDPQRLLIGAREVGADIFTIP